MSEKKHCPTCGCVKDSSEFYLIKTGVHAGKLRSYCIPCEKARNHARKDYFTRRNHEKGFHKPQSENKSCSSYLGIYVAERALSKFFDNITRMPANNPGYDFICGRGFKIDVKSGCLTKRKDRRPDWTFVVSKNKVADYFLCLAFDDRESLDPQHVWLIPGNVVNGQRTITIGNCSKSIARFAKYEKPVDKVIACCNVLRKDKVDDVEIVNIRQDLQKQRMRPAVE